MSTLLDKATSLIDHAKRVREAEALADRRSDYAHRRQALQSWATRYKELAARVDLLVRENVTPRERLRSERQDEVSAHVTGFLERFRENTSMIIEGDAFALLDRDLATVEQLGLQLLRTAWERHYDSLVPELREEAIEVRLAPPEVVERLESLHARLESLRRKSPPNAEEIQAFRSLVSQYDLARQEAWRSVLGDKQDVPQSVQEFVRSVQGSQACTLEILTPEILEWLGARGLAKRFRVQLA